MLYRACKTIMVECCSPAIARRIERVKYTFPLSLVHVLIIGIVALLCGLFLAKRTARRGRFDYSTAIFAHETTASGRVFRWTTGDSTYHSGLRV